MKCKPTSCSSICDTDFTQDSTPLCNCWPEESEAQGRRLMTSAMARRWREYMPVMKSGCPVRSVAKSPGAGDSGRRSSSKEGFWKRFQSMREKSLSIVRPARSRVTLPHACATDRAIGISMTGCPLGATAAGALAARLRLRSGCRRRRRHTPSSVTGPRIILEGGTAGAAERFTPLQRRGSKRLGHFRDRDGAELPPTDSAFPGIGESCAANPRREIRSGSRANQTSPGAHLLATGIG